MDQPNGLSGPAREPNDGVRFFEELLRQCGIPAENDHILIIRNLLYLLHESAFLAEHPWQPTQGAERPEIDLRSPIGWTKVAFQMEKLVHANLAQIHLLRADITPQMYTYRARLLIDGFVMVESATTFWKQEAIRGFFIAFNALAEKWGGGLRRWGRSNWGDTSS